MGVAETSLLAMVCLAPLALIFIGGGIFLLIKLGVISSYWFKGNAVEQGGNYTLNQSKDVAEDNEKSP